MARNLMSQDVKSEFGRRFRRARDAKKLSRATLGIRLGISPKTIQSWEMGRTFIEDLALIPAIEAELDISVSDLMARALGKKSESVSAESPGAYGKKRERPHPGPLGISIDLHPSEPAVSLSEDKLAGAWVGVPLLKKPAVEKPVAELSNRDVARHVVVPGDWVPRGGVLVAYRMSDSSMSPMIPLGGTVIVDRRPREVDKAVNKVVALFLQGKGLRIRRLIREPGSDKLSGMTALEGQRGKMNFRPDRGDYVLGKVVGVLAQPE